MTYRAHTIGSADFANGTSFRIDQVKAKGACRVTNLRDSSINYTYTIAAAWRSVRYMARIIDKTDRSS